MTRRCPVCGRRFEGPACACGFTGQKHRAWRVVGFALVGGEEVPVKCLEEAA